MEQLEDKKKASSVQPDEAKSEGKKKFDGENGSRLPGLPDMDFHFHECGFSVNVININGPVNICRNSDMKDADDNTEFESYFAELCSGDDAKKAALDNLKQYIDDRKVLKEFLEFLGVCNNTLALSTKIKKGLLKSGVIDDVVVKKGDFIDSLLAFAPKLTTGGSIKTVRAAISRSLNTN